MKQNLHVVATLHRDPPTTLQDHRCDAMSTRKSPSDQTQFFRYALLRIRGEQGWSQLAMAQRLGVSKRTLSTWENGQELPPFTHRMHLVVALHDQDPELVLEIADALGISAHPGVQPLLQQLRDSLEDESDDAPPPEPLPPPPPPPPRPAPDVLRRAVDAVVREAADALNVSANELRAVMGQTLRVCAELGANVEETREAIAVKAKKARATSPE